MTLTREKKAKDPMAHARGTAQKTLNRSVGGTVAIFLFLALFSVFMILPILYTIVTAFKPMNEIFRYPPQFFVQHPTTDNFIMMFQLTQEMWVPFERYLFNSLFVSITGTVAYVFICSMAAYPLAKRKTRVMTFLYQFVVLAILFRPEVTRIPQYIIMSRIGMINTFWALILPILASSFGVFLMRQFMVSIPDSLIEAARIDGASEYRIFFTLIMPMVKPAWLTLVIFTFRDYWSAGDTQYVYNESMKTLTTVLQQISSAGIARAGAGAAVALLLMIPPYAVFMLSQSSVMETMSRTGMKD